MVTVYISRVILPYMMRISSLNDEGVVTNYYYFRYKTIKGLFRVVNLNRS